MARGRAFAPATSTSAGSTSYAAKSTAAPLYVSSRTPIRFHGTCVSRANKANDASHLPESSSGRAARTGIAGAAINAALKLSDSTHAARRAGPNAIRALRIAAMRRLIVVPDRSHGRRVGAEADDELALLPRPQRRKIV